MQNLSDFPLGFDNPQFKSVCQKKWNLVWLNHCAASKFGQNLSQEFLISLGYSWISRALDIHGLLHYVFIVWRPEKFNKQEMIIIVSTIIIEIKFCPK